MLESIASLIVTCAELLGAPRPLPVSGPATMTQYGAWVMRCEDLPSPCVLAEARCLNIDSGPAWVKVYLARAKDALEVRIETPPLVMPSLIFDIDETESLTLDTNDCDNVRCRFRVQLEFKQAAKVRKAEALTLVMTPELGDTIKVPLDMDGFEAAMKALPFEF